MAIPTVGNFMQVLMEQRAGLTPRCRALADYVLENPGRAVFLRTRELADQSGVSESTVVRFIKQLGFQGYREFQQLLRDYVDNELTMLDRVELSRVDGADFDLVRRVVFDEIDNLKSLYEKMDLERLRQAAAILRDATGVFVVGSRLSWSIAYYLGWALAKWRDDVRYLKGSDSTTMDRMVVAPEGSLCIVVATSRYPNELIKISKLARRLKMQVIIISDSFNCPLNQFGDLALVAPSRHIPVVGSLSSLACLANCFMSQYISQADVKMRRNQERLERLYREQDLLFMLDPE